MKAPRFKQYLKEFYNPFKLIDLGTDSQREISDEDNDEDSDEKETSIEKSCEDLEKKDITELTRVERDKLNACRLRSYMQYNSAIN